jgi:hypothetical protein
MAILWAGLPVGSPVILERLALMEACAAGGDGLRNVVQRYRAIYYRATSYHQHLGDACQRQLCTCQYDIRGLRLLDFATDIGAARDGLLHMMFQLGGIEALHTARPSKIPHGSK